MRLILLMIPVLVLTVQPAVASQLSGYAWAECMEDMHVVHLSGTYYNSIEGEYTQIVLKRRTVGLCESDVVLLDDAQPFDPEGGVERFEYSFTFELAAPHPDAVYLYMPYAVTADGSLYSIQSNCAGDMRSFAQTDCDIAPFSRGVVRSVFSVFGWLFSVEPCEENCWLSLILLAGIPEEEFEALAGESPWNLVDTVVDVYGGRTYCRMLGQPLFNITRIARAPLGQCGPVPDRQTSWGSLKAQYR